MRTEKREHMKHVIESGNVIVGQSGGPTAVINASLAGVYKTALQRGAEKVYGMRYGIQGLLEEKIVDLSEYIKTDLDTELLRRTPSSYLGSCRYKLPEPALGDPVYEKIFTVLEKYDIRCFFYIGGNDSMDTIGKLYEYGKLIGTDIRFIGIPKTIDNDLMLTDHTPGYGSVAKYIATITKEIVADSMVYDMKSIVILEIMGRNAGWLTGATALAKGEDCCGVDLIYLPEVSFSMEQVAKDVREIMKTKQSIVIAVSEGVKDEKGIMYSELIGNTTAVDAFGHKMLSGIGQHLANYLGRTLNCKVRSIELSTVQRCGAHMVSRVDSEEAFTVGGAAVKAAFGGKSGGMVILKRSSMDPYICTTDVADVSEIANYEKKVPVEWISPAGNYVTDDFINYVRPLIQGELSPVMVKGLPQHITLEEK